MGKKNKNKYNQNSHLPFRLNIVFFVVFVLFAAIILQLGVVQILNGEEAQDEIDRTENTTTTIPVPRGEMYDRYGRVVVDNKPLYSITYTPSKGVQATDKLELAEKLAAYIDMDHDNLTDRDLKEYFFLLHEEEITERVEDKVDDDMDNGEVYKVQLDSIKDDEISGYDDQTKEVIAIKKELDQAYALAPHVVKNADISEKEYSAVAENLEMLPGINVTADWERDYPYESLFRSYIGGITSSKQGIPKDQMDRLMSLDYSRNDRVGVSGLEQQYEDVLRGTKEKVQYETDSRNNVINTKVVREGERGKDLVLTIDAELQEQVDKIVQEELAAAIQKAPGQNRHLRSSMAVVSNPKTGEILAISGQQYNRVIEEGGSRFTDVSHQAVYNSYTPGSSIKGATILTGLHEGAIQPGQTFFDKPMYINGLKKGSLSQNNGTVNDITALQKSSNVYMFFLARRLGGDYGMDYNVKGLSLKEGTLDKFVYNFNQFGLGVKTGIDFPYESTGVNGEISNPGEILDFSIGQFHSYTAMQLNQYVSTIANGGYRIQPHLVKSIHDPSQQEGLGPIYKDYDPKVLNRIDMDPSYIERVQEGFRQVFQTSGGTASSVFSSPAYKKYKMAGKTGTAEAPATVPDGQGGNTYVEELLNKVLVGYAPYDDPEIAFSVVTPHVGEDANSTFNVSNNIGARIGKAYFDLKEERAEKGLTMSGDEEQVQGTEEEQTTEEE
ncbi:UNVERIFIED_CONTAM: penicillin-binding protein 2 [Halobacillus marinus]|uniref:peptidoglycan D,D-transpeptidase FtsI family protein n=1 Tax=Bacillaceae TaxID=186817 RepID=UPI0002A516C3|nr:MULTISPECIES: penicillin-binding protein 2 [Bacillaceae]ELK46205.1 penicillin-binding protein [Halobacillus sp. BAB-2008]QHT47173.1 penicillin-binding protein 2 [Bacillus sp. SB49]